MTTTESGIYLRHLIWRHITVMIEDQETEYKTILQRTINSLKRNKESKEHDTKALKKAVLVGTNFFTLNYESTEHSSKVKEKELHDYFMEGFLSFWDVLTKNLQQKTQRKIFVEEIDKRKIDLTELKKNVIQELSGIDMRKYYKLWNDYREKFISDKPLVKGFDNDPLNFILHKIPTQELNFLLENMGSDPKKCRNNLKRYKIPLADFVWMVIKQGNKCACCGKPKKDNTREGQPNGCELCLDHCHTNGLVRGLLCRDCNSQVGGVDKYVRENPHSNIFDRISAKTEKYYEYVIRMGAYYMSNIDLYTRKNRFNVPIEDVNLQLKHKKQYRFHKLSEKNKKSSNDLTQFIQ